MRYQDFVVQIGLQPGNLFRARVVRSPAGEGETIAPLPPWLADLAPAAAPGAGERGAGPDRDVARRQKPAPQGHELGGQLHDLLFSGMVGRLWDRSLGSLRGRGDEGLRLRLQFDLESAAALAALPWELLYRADTGAYLALDRQTPVLRHLEVAQPVAPQPLPAALKVLGVAAAPRELAKLDLATEKEQLAGSRKNARGWQVGFLRQPTVDQLRRSLVEQGSHVLHFMGHGGFDGELGEGALYFEDGQGGALAFTGSSLATKLAGLPSLRLVVLNACETAISGQGGDPYGGVATALVRGGLPAVVAMQRPISDGAAIAFSKAFYRQLAAGGELEAALAEGRQAIHTLNPASAEWAIPVLFSRVAGAGLFTDPALAAARRRRWAAAAAAAALLLSLALPPVRAGLRAMLGGETVYSIATDQILATGVDGLEARLASVEILADGRIRLHFAFDNRTGKAQLLGFDFKKSYLADENGNAYRVKASSSPIPGGDELVETVPAGESRAYWVEVQAPQDGARRLHVEMVTPARSRATLTPFEVALPAYPEELSVPSPQQPPLPDSDPLPLNVKIDNGRKDVFSEVRKLEVSAEGHAAQLRHVEQGQPAAGGRLRFRQDRAARSPGQHPEAAEDGLFRPGPAGRPAARHRARGGRYAPASSSSSRRRSPGRRTGSWRWRPGPTAISISAGRPSGWPAPIFERARKSIEEFAAKAKPKLQVRPRVDPEPPPPPARDGSWRSRRRRRRWCPRNASSWSKASRSSRPRRRRSRPS